MVHLAQSGRVSVVCRPKQSNLIFQRGLMREMSNKNMETRFYLSKRRKRYGVLPSLLDEKTVDVQPRCDETLARENSPSLWASQRQHLSPKNLYSALLACTCMLPAREILQEEEEEDDVCALTSRQ